MEVNINKDIQKYEETVFFGLSIWQFVFCVLACGAAIGSYFLFKDAIGVEAVSWLCILSAFPFVAFGFIKYNGMNAGKLLWAIIKSVVLTPKHLLFRPVNIYYHLMTTEDKKGGKKDGKITQLYSETR